MKVIVALLPTLFMFYILIVLFPYTGLGRIVALPNIFILNTIIIILGIYITRKLNHRRNNFAWIAIVLLTVINTVVFYPQESSPSVTKQVLYSVSAINNFDNSPISDLDLPLSDDFDLKGESERYVVALYKYRQQIPLDGSFHTYGDEYDDTSIRSIEEIPKKLEGHHKVIWWYLHTFRNS